MSPHPPKNAKEPSTNCENNGDAIDDAAATSTEESCTACCYGGGREDTVMAPRGSSIPSMVHENGGSSVLIMSSGDSPGPALLPGHMPMKAASQQSGVERTCSQADEGYGTGKLASTVFSAEVCSDVETDGVTSTSNVETDGVTGTQDAKQKDVVEEEKGDEDKGMCEGESTNEIQHTHDSGAEPDLQADSPLQRAQTQSGELSSSLIDSSPSAVPRHSLSHPRDYARSRPKSPSLPPSVVSKKVYDNYCTLIYPFPTSMQSSDHDSRPVIMTGKLISFGDSAKSELVIATTAMLNDHHSVCVCGGSYVANVPGEMVTGIKLPVYCIGGEVRESLVCARVPKRDPLYAGPDWKPFM